MSVAHGDREIIIRALRRHAQYILDVFVKEHGYTEQQEDELHVNGLRAALDWLVRNDGSPDG
jgi:hypothetical protein